MAGQESLGNAVLYLTVDDKALRDGIRNAKAFVSKELGQAFAGGRGTSTRGKTGGTEGRFSDRAQATQVITRRLGDQLQRLGDLGIDVTRQFQALDRAGTAVNKNLIEVARAQNRGVADFIRNENRKLASAQRTQKAEADADRVKQRRRIAEGRRIGRLNISPILGGEVFPESPKRRARDFNIAKNWGTFLRDLRATAADLEASKTASAQYTKAKQFNARQSWIPFLQDLEETSRVIKDAKATSDKYKGAKQFNARQSWGPFLEDLRDTAQVIQNVRQEKADKRTRKVKDSWVKFLNDLDTTAAIIEKGRKGPGAKPAASRKSLLSRLDSGGRLSSGLIGGSFPLLFGQGPGAALGGAVGGFAGGGPLGFALSLVGTNIGQAVDEIVAKGKELATALKDPVNSIDQLVNSGTLSSKALEKEVAALADSGRAAEAATLAQMDLLATYNDLTNLENLVNAQEELDRTFAKLQVSVSEFVAGPLAELLKGVNRSVKGPQEGPSTLSRSLGLLSGGLVLAGGIAATTGLGAPAGAGLAALGGLAAVGAELTAVPNVDPKKALAALDKQLQLLQRIKEQKKLTGDIDELSIQIAKSRDPILRRQLELARLQKEEEKAIAALGKNAAKAKEDQVRLQYAEKRASLERSINQERLAQANREIDNQLRLLGAVLKLKEAQRKYASPILFGETQSSGVLRQVQQNVAGAKDAAEAARIELIAAQEKLLNAQLYGDAQDVREAATAVEEASINLETAGINVKIAMQEGATAILNNVKSSAQQLRDATRSLLDLRLGNLRFLPAKERNKLIREQIRIATPEARSRRVALRSREDVFAFNKFIQQERTARQDVKDAERNLNDANNALTDATVKQTGALATLTDVMSQLIDKSWSVYVKVPGQNDVQAMDLASQLN